MTTALITGASSGIGATFAQTLAAQKQDLILVARSAERLDTLAQDLKTQHGISTQVIVQDLSLPGASQAVIDATDGQPIDLLINNAGFGDYQAFHESDITSHSQMIQVNITALVELTHHYLNAMRQRGSGGIINVSSIGGFQPMPYWSTYAATKAFVLHFTEALWAENKETGVKILALCPGPTESGFWERAQSGQDSTPMTGMSLESPESVVQAALDALEKNESVRVTGGLMNQVVTNVPRVLPREVLVNLIGQQFQPDGD